MVIQKAKSFGLAVHGSHVTEKFVAAGNPEKG